MIETVFLVRYKIGVKSTVWVDSDRNRQQTPPITVNSIITTIISLPKFHLQT